MRKWMYENVTGCPGVSGFAADRVYTSGGAGGELGPDDMPSKPFIMIRLGINQQGTRLPGTTIRQQSVQVWLHTEQGSMLSTDALAEALQKHLPAQAPEKRADEVIIECEWLDTSGDGYDDHFKTETRYVTFLVTFKTTP